MATRKARKAKAAAEGKRGRSAIPSRHYGLMSNIGPKIIWQSNVVKITSIQNL